jgi:hypothetical protein
MSAVTPSDTSRFPALDAQSFDTPPAPLDTSAVTTPTHRQLGALGELPPRDAGVDTTPAPVRVRRASLSVQDPATHAPAAARQHLDRPATRAPVAIDGATPAQLDEFAFGCDSDTLSPAQLNHFLVLQYFNAKRKIDFLAAVKDQAAIAVQFSGGKFRAANEQLRGLSANATTRNACVISTANFCLYVREIARAMQKRRADNADFLVVQCNQLMALTIATKDHGKTHISFYDPGTVGEHYVIEAQRIENLNAQLQAKLPLDHYRAAGNQPFTLYARDDMFDAI